MAIRVTEVLGTDSMNNSRITINNNFKTLADAINKIDTALHSSIDMGAVSAESLSAQTLHLGDVSLNAEQLQQLLALITSAQTPATEEVTP